VGTGEGERAGERRRYKKKQILLPAAYAATGLGMTDEL
jgi:hypothetical protein